MWASSAMASVSTIPDGLIYWTAYFRSARADRIAFFVAGGEQ
jgi:hypothetical protein